MNCYVYCSLLSDEGEISNRIARNALILILSAPNQPFNYFRDESSLEAQTRNLISDKQVIRFHEPTDRLTDGTFLLE